MPTRTPVSADDHKLVFLVQNGRHYLREIWNSDGRQVVTSEFGMPVFIGRNHDQVPLVEKSQAREPNKATDSDPACVVAVSPGIRQNNNRCARLERVETEKMTDSRNPERQQAVSDFAPPATQGS